MQTVSPTPQLLPAKAEQVTKLLEHVIRLGIQNRRIRISSLLPYCKCRVQRMLWALASDSILARGWLSVAAGWKLTRRSIDLHLNEIKFVLDVAPPQVIAA